MTDEARPQRLRSSLRHGWNWKNSEVNNSHQCRTLEHKKKLKEEFGVEHSTFEQKIGEAVLDALTKSEIPR